MGIERKKLFVYLYGIVAVTIFGICISFNPINFLLIFTAIGVSVLLFVLLFVLKEKMLTHLVLLLVLSLFLLPSGSIKEISLRFDDYLVIFITLGLFFMFIYSRQKEFKEIPTPLKWLLVYLLYSLFITLANLVFGRLTPIYLLFFIKEIQYFIYLLVCFYLVRAYIPFESKFRKTFIFASVVSILWGVYQLLTGNIRGYYGIGIISVQNPSQSGILFLLMTLMLLYFSVTTKKKSHEFYLAICSFFAAAMTLATISRTAILGIGVVFSLYLGFSLFRRRWNFKKIFIVFYIAILAIPIGYKIIGSMVDSIFQRFSQFGNSADFRANIWESFLSNSDTLGLIFGNGKGFMQVIVGTFTLKADNMYVRLLVEIGYVGIVIWSIFILSIIFYGFVNMKHNYNEAVFLLILTIVFIIISVTQEAYIVSIQGSAYWLLTGFFLGKISYENIKRKNIAKHV